MRSSAALLAVIMSTGSASAGPVVVSTSTLSVDTASARRGVLVLAAPDTHTDASWPVAQAVYGDAALRPSIADAEARALAGDIVDDKATARVRELAELRAKVKGDDAASRAILAELARRTGARAIAIVSTVDGATEVRVWDAADDAVGSTRYRREASGWQPLVGTLRTRYAPQKVEPAPAPAKQGKSFVESPWFWAALGAAAAGGVAVYLLTRDNEEPRPVRVDWGSR